MIKFTPLELAMTELRCSDRMIDVPVINHKMYFVLPSNVICGKLQMVNFGTLVTCKYINPVGPSFGESLLVASTMFCTIFDKFSSASNDIMLF